MIMSLEMGKEEYEKGMKSNDQKKKTIKKFVEEPSYNADIRTLIRDLVLKEREEMGIRDIINLMDVLYKLAGIPIEPPIKRVKTD